MEPEPDDSPEVQVLGLEILDSGEPLLCCCACVSVCDDAKICMGCPDGAVTARRHGAQDGNRRP